MIVMMMMVVIDFTYYLFVIFVLVLLVGQWGSHTACESCPKYSQKFVKIN